MFVDSGRYEQLLYTIAGYYKTGIPLVAYNKNSFVPLITVADDMGLYALIPQLAHYFHLSLDQTLLVGLYSTTIVAFILGLTGFWLLYKNNIARALAALGLLGLTYLTLKMGIIYAVYAVIPMASIPLTISMCTGYHTKLKLCAGYMLVGFFIGSAQYIRAYSSLGVGITVIGLLCWYAPWSRITKIWCSIAFCLGITIPVYYFSNIYNQYMHYAASIDSQALQGSEKHVFWHSAYLGFGFLSNDLGIAWDDSVGQKKALAINPQAHYPSRLYEEVMRYETIKLFKHNIKFVLYTLFAKLGILLFYLLLCANLGLIAAWYYPKPWQLTGPLWAGMLFNSLFGLLAMPYTQYILGFIAFAVLYGIISCCYAVEKGAAHKVLNCLP